MNSYLLIILLILVYCFPTFISLFFSKDIQIPINYVYLGVLLCLTQLFNSLYSIQLNSNLELNAGDISYSAVLFTAIFLIISQPEPKVIRILMYFSIILSIFLFLIFYLTNFILSLEYVINYLEIDSRMFIFSYSSLLFSVMLLSSEILLLIFMLKKLLPEEQKRKRFSSALIISLIYLIVLMIDGIIYPIVINIFISNSQFSIINGILAKLIFGVLSGFFLFFLLFAFPDKMYEFISVKSSLRYYFLPPKKKLAEELEEAKKEIEDLMKIIPICSVCKKVKDDQGNWKQFESYLKQTNNMDFTHGYCPECFEKVKKDLKMLKS